MARETFVRAAVASLLALAVVRVAVAGEPATSLDELNLEELMNVPVVSASNVSERLVDAPATVIVISRSDIDARGYTDLSEILDDLPGMDVTRPWGATYFKDYWRGYRNTIGDPFLLMVDGVVFNHLYFNTVDIMTSIPISNVDRVEVVYGPASAVYGPNAFMGVINVITLSAAREGSSQAGLLSAGSSDARLADISVAYRAGGFGLRLTGRIDNGQLDPGVANQYEYTSNRYYGDRALWGGFIDNPDLGGAFESRRKNRGLDIRATFGSLEAGLQYYELTAGYGVEYAADRSQNNAVWSRPELSAFVRDSRALTENVHGTTMLRYRRSGVDNDSYFVEAASDNGERRRVDFSYWQSINDSFSVFEDVDIEVNQRLSLKTGIKYEQKGLQKAYDTRYGPALPPDQVDVATYPYPEPPEATVLANNTITTEDTGVYAQARYLIGSVHRVNLGVRVDNNSRYGTATNVRAGYVGTFGPWVAKAMYGEAFEEPNNRLLYGGWDGSGSDPTLDPERSRTAELSASYTRPRFSGLGSVYYVWNADTFINTSSGAENLGDRQVMGLDLHAQTVLPTRPGTSVKAWGYYSHIFRANENKHDLAGDTTGNGFIGDLAINKFWLGVTAETGSHFTATIRGRYIGDRRTVDSNPIRSVDGYATVDLYLKYADIAGSRLGVSLKVMNAGDEAYAQPGVRDANAGTTPGAFDSAGNWTGSGGFFNSLLPQPGRTFLLTMHLGK